MKKTVLFYRLHHPPTGATGPWTACNDYSDVICCTLHIPGPDSTQGRYEQYDSYEAYHMDGWAQEKGLEVERAEVEVDLPDPHPRLD